MPIQSKYFWHLETPTFGMQIKLWIEQKWGLAGTEEMNNVILEKHLNYLYF